MGFYLCESDFYLWLYLLLCALCGKKSLNLAESRRRGIVALMEGVTTAIVAFLFVCVVFPTIVKNKPQYYAAFAAILLVILLSGLEAVIATGSFHAFATFMITLLQVSAMILLVLSAGGL